MPPQADNLVVIGRRFSATICRKLSSIRRAEASSDGGKPSGTPESRPDSPSDLFNRSLIATTAVYDRVEPTYNKLELISWTRSCAAQCTKARGGLQYLFDRA